MLHVHRAERADGLIDALRELLADPLGDPFAGEVVAVPTRGVERWLAQRLATRLGVSAGRADGVCANVGFPSPRRLVGDAVAAASGIAPDADPWLPERSVWPLLEVVDGALDEPWLATLASHLSVDEDARRARRFATVRHLADLFDRYAVHRPEMVLAWARGEDTDGGAAARPLPAQAAWQAELWRRLRARLDQPGPAERLADACARLRTDPALAGLPPRLSLFGLTRLPAAHLQVLAALAAARDVHLFLLHPSPALWERIAALPPAVRRADDATAALARNRLLASWGNDARELQHVVAHAGEVVDDHRPLTDDRDTLLARVQADVRADRAPAGPPLPGAADARPLLAPGDRTLEVHACHGRARQVEVVRDAILHLLAEDPTLEPRDVIVMCPDIETFAPLIQATFGAGEVTADEDGAGLDALPDDVRPPDLRVRLADRSLRQTNPVLGVVGRLVDLAEQRLTASQVLDLADREPVRRRFALDDDDLARLEDWVAESGIRWGLDAEHRAPYKLDALPDGTWRAGLDRVLVGVAMPEDGQRLFGGVLPLDDVEERRAIDLAGRFAELVDRLRAALDALAGPKTVRAWAEVITDAADALTVTGHRDAWQRAELQRILDDVVTEAAVGGAEGTSLALPEVRALLAERLQGRPTRANFRTGHLTVCTLVPMRSVPHRVVCLLGLDDGVFPRRTPRDGDDLILDDPHVGDRDARSEDRQLLLDALLAARDRLIVTYSGNDERTNVERPAAVPVGELLDVVDRTVRLADGAPARTAVTVRHPLQPFDPRNFVTGELVDGRPWSFDPVTLDGARALCAERAAPRPFLLGPLDPDVRPVVELDGLVAFVRHPVRAFLRRRLEIRLSDRHDEVDDALPVELDPLDRYDVGERLVGALLAGAAPEAAAAAERARGSLPPGRLAEEALDKVLPLARDIVAHARGELGGHAPSSVDVKVALPGDRWLTGTVPQVCGDVLRHVTYAKVKARDRIGLWVRWLALSAAHPHRPFEAVVVGRAQDGAPREARVTIARFAAIDGDAAARRAVALAQLRDLVDLLDRGMREPLPLACLASAAYADAARHGADAVEAARRQWTSEWSRNREDRDLEHQFVLGGVLTFDELLALPPQPGESGDGWHDGEASRFGRYARRLWEPMLAMEALDHR